MKVFISADIEGIAGVMRPEQCNPAHADYAAARELMEQEVNAAMARGTALEPAARACYERITGHVMQPLVLEVFTISRFDMLFEIFPDRAAALADMTRRWPKALFIENERLTAPAVRGEKICPEQSVRRSLVLPRFPVSCSCCGLTNQPQNEGSTKRCYRSRYW